MTIQKNIFILFTMNTLFTFSVFASSIETLTIANKPFTLVKSKYNEYGTKGEILLFYKGHTPSKDKKVFLFILNESKGSCDAKSTQKGIYTLHASGITFYSQWMRSNKAEYAPIGVKIEVYKILSNSQLEKISSKLYIEASKKGYEKNSGMQYLFETAQSPDEKALYKAYIAEIEERYKGEFVFGEERQKLRQKVNEAFQSVKLWQ